MILRGEVHLPAGPGHRRPQGARDHRAARLPSSPSAGVKVIAGAPVLEKGVVHDFKELSRIRHSAAGRGGPRVRSRPATKPPQMVAWRASTASAAPPFRTGGRDRQIRPDRQGHHARGQRRRHQPHQQQPHRVAVGARVRACASSSSGAPSISSRRQRAHRRCRRAACAPNWSVCRRVILGADGPRRLRRAAARHAWHGRAAGEPGRRAGGRTDLLRHGNTASACATSIAADRSRPLRRFRAHRQCADSPAESWRAAQLGDLPGIGMIMIDGIVRSRAAATRRRRGRCRRSSAGIDANRPGDCVGRA